MSTPTQWGISSIRLLLCKKTNDGLGTEIFLLQPVPGIDSSLTRDKLKKTNYFLHQQSDGWMAAEDFTAIMRAYVISNGLNDFIAFNKFQASMSSLVIATVLNEFEQHRTVMFLNWWRKTGSLRVHMIGISITWQFSWAMHGAMKHWLTLSNWIDWVWQGIGRTTWVFHNEFEEAVQYG